MGARSDTGASGSTGDTVSTRILHNKSVFVQKLPLKLQSRKTVGLSAYNRDPPISMDVEPTPPGPTARLHLIVPFYV